MGTNIESFSKPVVRVIHGKPLVDFYQLIFYDKFLILNGDDLIIFFLLIQSNAENGATSAIAFNENSDGLGLFFCRLRNRLQGFFRNVYHKLLLLSFCPIPLGGGSVSLYYTGFLSLSTDFSHTPCGLIMQVTKRYNRLFPTHPQLTHCISPFYQQVIHTSFLHVADRALFVPPCAIFEIFRQFTPSSSFPIPIKQNPALML